MFKQVPKEIKEEIINKVENGQRVGEVATQYGINPKTIYGWLKRQIKSEVSTIELNKLKRENEELKRIIGIITLELERRKKNRDHWQVK